MTDFKVDAEKREKSTKEIRKENLIPAVVYGKNFKNVNLALNEIAFNRIYKEAGSSNLIDLNLGQENIKVLVHDIQRHPVTDQILHVDFLKIDMKEKIKTEIPLEFVGETALVIEQEGSLITNKDSVEAECLPNDLVDHIKVDISVLTEFDQNIKVSDIRAPQGIEILDDPEEVVVLVQPPRSDEELEALEEEVVENVEAVEVEEKGKEEEVAEGEEGAEAGEKPEEAAAESKPDTETPTVNSEKKKE